MSPSTNPSSAAPLVRLRGVSRRYATGGSLVHALRDVTLDLPGGAFVAVVGRSGSGKSTLLHLLAAMDQPTSGSVTVGPWDIGALSRREAARYRREMVGMVFQQFHLVPTMTAAENAALPLVLAGVDPATRARRAADVLERVGLGHRATHRPSELSGGEQQRVAIARALALDAPLVLCDEPTGNLDSVTATEIVDLLATLHREAGKTIVVVTHDESEVAGAATHRVRLSDGRVVSVDATAAVASPLA